MTVGSAPKIIEGPVVAKAVAAAAVPTDFRVDTV